MMNLRVKFSSSLLVFLLTGMLVRAQDSVQALRQKWVDSVYTQMSLDEKIGQLFMVAAYSGSKNLNKTAIRELVQNNQVGGLIFMQGTPEQQAELTNEYQRSSKVP